MLARSSSIHAIAFLFIALVLCAFISPAFAQTPISGGFEISLLPGYKHEPLQGIDSVVGKIVSKEGVEIMYEIGPVPAKGAPLFGGSFVNQAQRLPEGARQWLKEQTVGGQKFSIAYGKDQRLVVSSAFAKQGINFSATAKTPGDVADVVLMAVSLTEKKAK